MANPPWNKGPVQSTSTAISYTRKRYFVYVIRFCVDSNARFVRTFSLFTAIEVFKVTETITILKVESILFPREIKFIWESFRLKDIIQPVSTGGL